MPTPSELAAAYRTLDIAGGANEAAVREARVLLAKVWHPDRHANDPELLAHAQRKAREINEAFALIRAAGFPSAPVAPVALTRVADLRSEARTGRATTPAIHFVARRRLRWSVVLVLCAAAGIGVYAAIVKLRATPDPWAVETDPWAVAPRKQPQPINPTPRIVTTTDPVSDQAIAAANAAEQASRSLVYSEWQRSRDVKKLDGLVVEVDQLIESHDYERAELAASRIHWTIFENEGDHKIEASYDKIRDERLAIIKSHR